MKALNIRKSDTEMFVREISKRKSGISAKLLRYEGMPGGDFICQGNITRITTTGSCNRRSQGSQLHTAYAGVSLCQETQ